MPFQWVKSAGLLNKHLATVPPPARVPRCPRPANPRHLRHTGVVAVQDLPDVTLQLASTEGKVQGYAQAAEITFPRWWVVGGGRVFQLVNP